MSHKQEIWIIVHSRPLASSRAQSCIPLPYIRFNTQEKMSNVYVTEPQTAGRVIFETTHGPLEITLWSRECPSTTKLFLQLCQDGFYDDMVFHRIVPNFLVQTGAIRHGKPAVSTAELNKYRAKVNADAILERRQYELNSRIRFNHRGQVAMALGANNDDENNDDDTLALLQPQFFITLDEASHLDGKHVVFGTINGPTIFNALRIGGIDVDETTHQPTQLDQAPRIERVKIMENPIHTDIVPTVDLPWKNLQANKGPGAKKKKKRKGVKNINVLSFGDELEEGMEANEGSGMKSSHDVISSGKLSNKVDETLQETLAADDNKGEARSKKTKKDKKSKSSTTASSKLPPSEERTSNSMGASEASTGESLHRADLPPTLQTKTMQEQPEVAFVSKKEKEQKKLEAERQEARQKAAASQAKKEKAPKISLVEMRRAKYANKGAKDKRKREEDTMAKLAAFQSKIVKKSTDDSAGNATDNSLAARMARKAADDNNKQDDDSVNGDGGPSTYHGQVLENEDDVGSDWMKTKFKCRRHMDHTAKNLGGDGRDAMEDYEVVEGDVGTDGRRNDRDGDDRKRRKHHHRRHHHHKSHHKKSKHDHDR